MKDQRGYVTVHVVGEGSLDFVKELIKDAEEAAKDCSVNITTLNTSYSAEIEKDKK